MKLICVFLSLFFIISCGEETADSEESKTSATEKTAEEYSFERVDAEVEEETEEAQEESNLERVNVETEEAPETPRFESANVKLKNVLEKYSFESVNTVSAYVGDTALIEAVREDDFVSVKILVENGADVNAKNYKNWTPLKEAILINSLKIVKYLVDNGAAITKEDELIDLPLNIAVNEDNLQMVKYLVENGADVNAKDRFGRNSLDYAYYFINSSDEVIEYLKSQGAEESANFSWEDILSFAK